MCNVINNALNLKVFNPLIFPANVGFKIALLGVQKFRLIKAAVRD